MPDYKPLEWLKAYRETAGLTQLQVAKKAKIHRGYYSMIESGHRSPGLKLAKRLGIILNFDWTLFFNQ